jgi:ADP-ribosyl-[dinitrogen reductase] hydrolase
VAVRTSPAVQQRALVAYLGLAVGDALGATVEFMGPAEIAAKFGRHDTIQGGGWLKLRPGQVTDDTTMSLALGRSILAVGTVDAAASAQAFSDWMANGPMDVGNTVRRGITHFRYSGEAEMPQRVSDAGNGACMRTLPVALATLGQPPGVVLQASRAQAHVTHNSPLSDAATECVIALIQAALLGATKDELLDGAVERLVHEYPEFEFRGHRMESPTGFIVDTMQAVLQAFFQTNEFEACLIEVVNRGGDADTTGAIAGMLAGSLYGRQSIPERWLSVLDPRVYQECTYQSTALLRLDFSAPCAGEQEDSISEVARDAYRYSHGN